MTKTSKIFLSILAGGSGALGMYYLLKFIKKRMQAIASEQNFDFDSAANFVISQEGFSATPYWDYSQWTWGYGTAAGYDQNNKPQGVISQANAKIALIDRLKTDYVKIATDLNSPISQNQMIALLDFSFNLGYGDAKKIVNYINSGATSDQITAKMQLYINAGGVASTDLIDRRAKESDLFLS